MKRLGWTACLVCVSLLALRAATSIAQGPDIGPGAGGAALKNPFDTTPVRPAPPAAPRPGSSEIEKTFFGKGPGTPAPSAFPDLPKSDGARPKGLAALKPTEKDDINKDIAVSASHSPWMISVMSYVGPDAPQMARDFVFEVRATHKLQAFVFNYGAEERKKEYERVKEMVDKQKKFCEDNNLPLGDNLRVRYTYVPDQCAVLIAGYASEEAAHRDLKRIRDLPPPDPKKVKLDTKFFSEYDFLKHTDGKQKSPLFDGYKPPAPATKSAVVAVNPFQRAFLVRNPTTKADHRDPHADAYDMPVLKKLNKGEQYSLLECKKPLTLAITQFRTPTTTEEPPATSGGLLAGLGFGKKKERGDTAAFNANVLAENLRKAYKLDAYVLHTRFSSVVTVGGYDSVDDPNLRVMKNLLQTRVRIPALEMFPEPYLMKVPR